MSDPNEPTTLGAYLREARRRKRVSLERAAEQTRIRADFLMRMESDDFDFLAPAYVRGFLSSYARFLGLPIDTLLEEFDRRFGTGRVDTAQMIAADRKRSKATGERRFGAIAIILFAVAGLLLLFAVIGLASGTDDPQNARGVALNPTKTPTPKATETPTPKVTETPTPTPSITITPLPTETTASSNEATVLQVVAARGDCWVEVAVDGDVVFSEVLGEGNFRFFSAKKGQQMLVKLGAAPMVDLVLNEEPLPQLDANIVEFTLPDEASSLGA